MYINACLLCVWMYVGVYIWWAEGAEWESLRGGLHDCYVPVESILQQRYAFRNLFNIFF